MTSPHEVKDAEEVPRGSVDPFDQRPLRTHSPTRLAARRFVRHRLALVGIVFLIIIALVAIFAPILAPFEPNQIDLEHFRAPPTARNWFGTDSAGRDVLSRIIFGARVSVTIGLVAAVSAATIGAVFGLVAGMNRGFIDSALMRLVDIVLSFPSLLVIILLVAILQPSLITIILVIALFEWPTSCRIVRQSTLSLREQDFVLSARAVGSSRLRIALKHIVPAILSPLTVVITLISARAILLEAALSFLGLGVSAPLASWGGMLEEAQSLAVLRDMPWLWLPPGIAIALTVLAINFVGDGLRDAMDPRQQM